MAEKVPLSAKICLAVVVVEANAVIRRGFCVVFKASPFHGKSVSPGCK